MRCEMVGGMVTAHHNLVGSARVSTVIQAAQLQRDALTAAGFWNSAFRQGSTGQSSGKQVARTRLIDEWTGRPLGAGRAFLRLLAHLFDSAACYLGWLFPIWDRPKRQTFADKIMPTIVVPASEPPQPP